jgi:hypothetical protein
MSRGYRWVADSAAGTLAGPNDPGIAIAGFTLNDFEAEVGGPIVRMRWVLTIPGLAAGLGMTDYIAQWEMPLQELMKGEGRGTNPNRFLWVSGIGIGWGLGSTGGDPPSFALAGNDTTVDFVVRAYQDALVKVADVWTAAAEVMEVTPITDNEHFAIWAQRDSGKVCDLMMPTAGAGGCLALGVCNFASYYNRLALYVKNNNNQPLIGGRIVVELIGREL